MGRSFGLFIALRCTCLGTGRDLIVCRTVLVLAVGLEVLVVVAIGVVVSVLLWTELVHLLRACAKLVWAAITSHSHVRRRLLVVTLSSINILRTWAHAWVHARIHAIHRWWGLMALLRSLVHHHGTASARARISVDTWHLWRHAVSWWHKTPLAALRKHLGRADSRWETLGGYEHAIGVWHHDWTHGTWLWHVLMAVRH